MPRLMSPETFDNIVKRISPSLTRVSEFTAGGDAVSMRCETCNTTWSVKNAHQLISSTPSGCPTCVAARIAKNQLFSQQDFIKKVADAGAGFDVTNANYIDSRTKITGICKSCGTPRTAYPNVFYVTPVTVCKCQKANTRVRGSGAVLQRILTEFEGRYDVSKAIYVDQATPMTLICRDHGVFTTSTKELFRGYGCPGCRLNEKAKIKKELLAKKHISFVERANVKHDYKYDYSKAAFQGTHVKLDVICDDHGLFSITPGNHLIGRGCPKCSKRSSYAKATDTKAYFLNKLAERNPNVDCTDTTYKNSGTKVDAKCKTCSFRWKAMSYALTHPTKPTGCPMCAGSSMERKVWKLLKTLGIKHEFEYQAKLLLGSPKDVPNYRYDFYLPELNILVEIHGSQHYVPNKFKQTEEEFNEGKRRDLFKIKLAHELSIPLIVLESYNRVPRKVLEGFIHSLSLLYPYYTDRKFFKSGESLLEYANVTNESIKIKTRWLKEYLTKKVKPNIN